MRRLNTPLVRDVLQTFLLTVLFFVVVQTFVGQPYQVEMHSMQGTLEPGQYVFVDKLTPRFDSYHRGDIVVFGAPEEAGRQEGVPFIKRVIGVPGDTIEIHDGLVFVNGEALEEPYLFADAFGAQPTETGERASWRVDDGELFLMGDHRTESVDSRAFGPVPIGSVIGRAWLRYWPLDSVAILGGGTAQAARAEPPVEASPAP
jgi:signal peptidase I